MQLLFQLGIYLKKYVLCTTYTRVRRAGSGFNYECSLIPNELLVSVLVVIQTISHSITSTLSYYWQILLLCTVASIALYPTLNSQVLLSRLSLCYEWLKEAGCPQKVRPESLFTMWDTFRQLWARINITVKKRKIIKMKRDVHGDGIPKNNTNKEGYKTEG